jgi:putative copper resistance protein D
MDLAVVLIAARFALYLDLMLVFGLPLFSLYTLRTAGQRASVDVIRSSTISILLLAGIALSAFSFLLIAAVMSDVPVHEIDRDALRAMLDDTAIGTAAKVRTIALLAALPLSFLLRAKPRTWWALASGLGAVALGSLAWTGHGAADEGRVGLVLLLARANKECDDPHDRAILAHRGLDDFAIIGTISVALLIVTGIVNSWILVGPANFLSLPASLYGRLLLIKLLLFAGMLGLAALNRFRLTPAIKGSLATGQSAAAVRSMSYSVAVEAILAVAVLMLVAWIGTLDPLATTA